MPGLAWWESYFPSSIPWLARRSYALELVTTVFFSMTLAGVEGGVIGNIVKKSFAALSVGGGGGAGGGGTVAPETLRYTVALLAAAPELANIVSFLWSSVAHGRRKIPVINTLQIATIACVLVITFVPITPGGLALLALAVLLARLSWSGIITLRPTVWRQNYPRSVRARIVGNFSTIQVLTGATMAIVMGMAMDADPDAFRTILPIVCLLGMGAFYATRLQRVRREPAMLRAERESGECDVMKPWTGPIVVWRTMKRDRWWAKFMGCMFMLGAGNLLIMPTMIILLDEEFRLGYLQSMIIATALPATMTAVAIPLWAKLLDRAHVVRFRAIHSWVFVVATLVMLCGAVLHRVELIYVGAALQGFGLGGGALAWNLGHLDFAPPAQTSQYMATHVTLNGVRGLLMPFIAVLMYNWASDLSFGGRALGSDAAIIVLSLAAFLSLIGAIGFGLLQRQMGQLVAASRRAG